MIDLQIKKEFITHPVFIISLLLLLLNDFIFKSLFSNFFTGKLSDFTGIIVFTLLLLVFFHKYRKIVFLFVILFFTFWKSNYSDFLIEFLNSNFHLNYVRTIDFSDLSCFIVLVPLYFFDPEKTNDNSFKRLIFSFMICLSVFSMISTSRYNPIHYGTIPISKKIVLKCSKKCFLEELSKHKIEYVLTNHEIYKTDTVEYYDLQKFLIQNDTIYKALISLEQKNKRKIILKIHKISITNNGTPLILKDYSKKDSVIKVNKSKTVTYFKQFKKL